VDRDSARARRCGRFEARGARTHTHLFIHSHSHSLIHTLTRTLTYSYTHITLTYSYTHTHLFMHSQYTCSLPHAHTHARTHTHTQLEESERNSRRLREQHHELQYELNSLKRENVEIRSLIEVLCAKQIRRARAHTTAPTPKLSVCVWCVCMSVVCSRLSLRDSVGVSVYARACVHVCGVRAHVWVYVCVCMC